MLLRKQVQPCFKRGSLTVKIWIRWILKILALALVAYLWFLNLVSNIQIDPQTLQHIVASRYCFDNNSSI
jgi:CRISPR/Cas system endoribonuclease Cas6 (RAMP superfamily)